MYEEISNNTYMCLVASELHHRQFVSQYDLIKLVAAKYMLQIPFVYCMTPNSVTFSAVVLRLLM